MTALPLAFDAHGLIPVVVQDELTGEVRMLAFANLEAVQRTMQTGQATFWSRSRQELWQKGLTRGSEIHVSRIFVDCDADSIIYSGNPLGNSCHTGAPSCFFHALDGSSLASSPAPWQTVLARLEAVLEARKSSSGAASYTKRLYERGTAAIGEKIAEEAGELAQALVEESDVRVVSEAADLLYHTLVGLRSRGIALRDVLAELARREGVSGLAEKASRKAADGNKGP
ncbi:MAG: bifunctional phosphoribosyl-AMP cyclohydrolase/phosphoribosyl-ATP diphosphatase HisIE [Polyangiaceae bacterium]|jgi:phosphoribosyl-ATP pyrophosphohydrolase/phosphoribosyl-AMP cyclohydrolase